MTAILELFKKATPLALAERELEEARRDHLNSCTALDYACALTNYNAARIERLEALIRNSNV